MRALVTGGVGFIGTNLSHRLLSDGNEVILFDNLSRAGVQRAQRINTYVIITAFMVCLVSSSVCPASTGHTSLVMKTKAGWRISALLEFAVGS